MSCTAKGLQRERRKEKGWGRGVCDLRDTERTTIKRIIEFTIWGSFFIFILPVYKPHIIITSFYSERKRQRD